MSNNASSVSARLAQLSEAASLSRRSLGTLILELFRLRFEQGKIGYSEYIDFRLYENDLSLDEKRAFFGARAQLTLYELTCDEYCTFLGYDKLTQYAIMTGLGLPMPKLMALYAPQSCRECPAPVLATDSQFEAFLNECHGYPLYLKRCHGNYGRGNIGIKRYHEGLVETTRGEAVRPGDFLAQLHDPSGLGWLIQATLRPHPVIRDISGEQLSGLRFYTIQTKNGPVVHRAVWKVNAGSRISDNFEHGTSGNMAAAVDLDSGVVKRVVAKVGFQQTESPVHPISQRELLGFQLPDWEEAKALAVRVTKAFPGVLTQGLDIALTDAGPVVLEMNMGGDVDLPQQAYRKGFFDDAYRGYLEELGIAHLLKGPSLKWYPHHGGARRGRRSQHWRWW